MTIMAIFGHFWPVFDLLRPWHICQTLPTSICVLVLTGLNKIGQKILNYYDQFDKNADFGQFSPLQLRYSLKILRDPVFMSVLVRVKSTTHLWDHNTPELAKKSVFTPKIAKKWIFERGALKLEQNGGQIRAQHEKICRNSEVPELNTIFGPTLP